MGAMVADADFAVDTIDALPLAPVNPAASPA
jgi:hypothetical protein